jgi:ribosomal protein L9
MAFFGKRKEKRKFTQQNPLFKRRKFCRFTAAGVDGRLFGSVTNADIAEGLKKASFEAVEKAQVRLPNGQLKAIGEYPVQVALHADVVVDITVLVEGELS